MTETFGDRLKKLRLDRDLSQEDLAGILGTSKQVISRYETNQRAPKITIVNEYAAKLGVPLGYLLGDEEKPTAMSDDELWNAIRSDDSKLMLARWISNLDQDQLQMVVKLLEAARLSPNE